MAFSRHRSSSESSRGLSPDEVCDHLEISEANQRVLLHRTRAAVRRAVVPYLDGDDRALPQAD